MLNNKIINVIKIGITVVSLATTLAASYISGKELDLKISDKVTEALKNES